MRWLALLLVFLPAGVAEAHGPALLDPQVPYVVDDATVSRALYGEFTAPDQVFVVRMHVDQRIALPFEMLVPRRDELRDLRPVYQIVADGQPVFTEPDDAATREVVFESFLRRVYWSSGAIAVVVPAGDVEIRISSPNGALGKFALGFGVEEGGIDYGDVLDHWSDYAY